MTERNLSHQEQLVQDTSTPHEPILSAPVDSSTPERISLHVQAIQEAETSSIEQEDLSVSHEEESKSSSPGTSLDQVTDTHEAAAPISLPVARETPSSAIRTFPGPMDRYLMEGDIFDDVDGDGNISINERGRLLSLRAHSLRLRAALQRKRTHLNDKEIVKSAADERFINFIRRQRSMPTIIKWSDSALEDCYSEMELSRSEYGPLRDEYDQMERNLLETEFEMAKLEGRLYKSKIIAMPKVEELEAHPPDEILSMPRDVPDQESFLGLDAVFEDRYHPKEIRYMSRLGDLDLAKEKYHNMTLEYEMALEEQNFRSHANLEVDEYTREFLTGFALEEAELKGKISEIERDVERLRQDCLDAGVDLERESEGSDSSSIELEGQQSGYLIQGDTHQKEMNTKESVPENQTRGSILLN